MPPEPARPHAGPWRIMDDDDWSAPVLVDADGAELYWLERVEATAADDALMASAPALRAACAQACVAMSLKYGHDRGTLEEGYEEVMSRHGGGMAYAYEMLRAALHAATAPAAPGESS